MSDETESQSDEAKLALDQANAARAANETAFQQGLLKGAIACAYVGVMILLTTVVLMIDS